MEGSVLGQRVIELAAAHAVGFQSIVAADDAIFVVLAIGAKTAAHGTAFGDVIGHARGSERLEGAISNLSCGGGRGESGKSGKGGN